MLDDRHLVTPLTSRRFFVGLFLAAYAMLAADIITRVGFTTGWPTLVLGALYVGMGTLGFEHVARSRRQLLTYSYFSLMVPLGAGLSARSTIGGTVLLLVVAVQSIRVLPALGTFMIGLPLPLLNTLLAWPDALRESVAFGVALVFLYVLSRAILDSEQARAALDRANQQLRAYAAQSEELAAARERNRIAREIHDGLGHSLTTIHMQLQAAQSILDRDRPRAEQVLTQAQQLARTALGDVRRSVATLRLGRPEARPLPAALATLVESTRSTELAVTLALLGEPRSLEPEAELALYRTAQEGLTNVLKHAGARSATITLDYRSALLVRLTVVDDGHGATSHDGGFGLAGLRERAELVGGTLHITTPPNAGLELAVEVPG